MYFGQKQWMSTKYKVAMPDTAYFITLTIVGWIDVFTRPRQKYLLVNSLSYCQKEKGLEIYAYYIMSSHMHMLCKANDGLILSDIIRDFKKYTSKKIVQNLLEHPESRREWMLSLFQKACSHLKRDQNYKVWQDGYHAEIARSNWFIKQKIDYIHNNPVDSGFVVDPVEWKYSSAKFYAEEEGVLEIDSVGFLGD